MKKNMVLLIALVLIASCSKQTATAEPDFTGVPATDTEQAQPEESASPPAQRDCTDSAVFVSDVTIPDGTSISAGQPFTKTWRIENTGTCTWTLQYNLVFVQGESMSAPETTKILPPTVPGETIDISVDLTAPEANGTYRADFQLLDPDGNPVPIDEGWYLWVTIAVENSTLPPQATQKSGNPEGPGFAQVTCSFTTDTARAVEAVNAINVYRAQNGLPPYKINTQLTLAAQAHSQDMACNNLFVHKGSNGSTPQSRVAAAGYQASYVSENVYGRYPAPTGQEAVTWWATDQIDPLHNANLISTQYTEIGAGYAFFDNFGYFAVVFATP
ncbi:MAG: hypothetical protein Kow002_10920 [Anaerolineales bacterium]